MLALTSTVNAILNSNKEFNSIDYPSAFPSPGWIPLVQPWRFLLSNDFICEYLVKKQVIFRYDSEPPPRLFFNRRGRRVAQRFVDKKKNICTDLPLRDHFLCTVCSMGVFGTKKNNFNI